MKKGIVCLIVGGVSFVAGAVAGWFARKKTAEVQFEVVDIQEAVGDTDGDEATATDIGSAIEQCFTVDTGAKEQAENNDISAVKAVDTQKEQYFKKWKAEEAVQKYDTRTKEDPADPVVSEDLEEGFDHEFLDEAVEEHYVKGGPTIEPATIADWNHWMGISEGEYEPIEIRWFEGDGVLTDEDGDPLQNPGELIGFDVARRFNEIDEETTGDPDIRVIYNHKKKVIFQIIRNRGSYARKKGMEEYGSDYGDEDDEEGDE